MSYKVWYAQLRRIRYLHIRKEISLPYRCKKQRRDERFQRSYGFLEFREIYLPCIYFTSSFCLLGTNEITLVFRRIETFIGDEKTLSQVHNRLNREIWFCKDFVPSRDNDFKIKFNKRFSYSWNNTIGKLCCKNEIFRGKFELFVSLESLMTYRSSILFVALQFSDKRLTITIYNYVILNSFFEKFSRN